MHRPPEQQVRSQAVGPSHLVTLHMRQQQKAGGPASMGAESATGSVPSCHYPRRTPAADSSQSAIRHCSVVRAREHDLYMGTQRAAHCRA